MEQRERLDLVRFLQRHHPIGQDLRLLLHHVDLSAHDQDSISLQQEMHLLVRAWKDDDLAAAGEILQCHKGHRRPALGRRAFNRSDQTAHGDGCLIRQFQQLVERHVDPRRQRGVDVSQRMVGDVQTQHLLFHRQQFLPREFLHRARGSGGLSGRSLPAQIKQSGLPGRPRPLHTLGGLHSLIQQLQQLGARHPQGVQRARLDQTLQHAPVHRAGVHPFDHIGQRGERAGLLAGLQDRLHGSQADILHRRQAEPDGVAGDREVFERFVHIGGEHADAHAHGLGDGGGNFVGVPCVTAEHRGHVLRRVVGLQVRGVVGDQPVAGRVGAVEAIAGERFELLEDLLGDVPRHPLLHTPGDELRALLLQFVSDLLADGVSQHVRLGGREPGHRLRRCHHIFLIDHHAVGLAQHRL